MATNNDLIPVLKNGQITETEREKATYSFVSPNQFFNEAINLLPAQNSIPPARVFYANKFVSQALPIKDGDAPYVQTLKDADTDETFEDYLGKRTGVVTLDDDDVSATITNVTPDRIEYKNNKGVRKVKDLYNNFVFNRKTGIYNTPLVKKGDVLNLTDKPILAKTNYTNDKGTLNIGKNARTAYVALEGHSVDDAIVLSQSFADKLTSHHMYQFNESDTDGITTGYTHFTSLFPKVYGKDKLQNIDPETGVVRVGATVNAGDPLILSSKPRMVSSKDQVLGKLSKFIKNTRTDASVKWEKDYEGTVTKVVKTRQGYKINISANAPTHVGDKVSVRSGSKTTVSLILPDEQMPRTEDGKPIDVAFNHLGLVSRINANMIQEGLLGKIAEKTGNIYKLPTFNKSNERWYDYVENELNKHGVAKTERIFDPRYNRWLDQPVTVGNNYFFKLHHTSDSKLSSRGQGAYDMNELPLKGGDEMAKAKRVSGLEINGLLSAGAYDVIKDAIHVRGQRNDDYWRQVREGLTPTLLNKTPFVWDKYLALTRGTGIDTIETPDGKLRASPFTDKQFNLLNPVEIGNPNLIDFKTLKPVDNGLFDSTMSLSSRWGKITLDQPYPNPGFEDSIATLLNLKKSEMYSVMQGQKDINGKTGNNAIKTALDALDLPRLLEEAKDTFKTSKSKPKQQHALKVMGIISGLNKNNLKASDYMINSVPVIPSKFRPYSMRGDTFIPGDVNELYQDLINTRDTQLEIKTELGEDAANENGINIYNSMKALYGFGETPNKKLQQRGVSGFLNKLIGNTSKYSFLNRAVLSKPVDFSARGVIDVNPELSIDEIQLPIDMAFTLFGPRVQRRLKQQGMSSIDSLKAIKDKTEKARTALDYVRSETPVWGSRAPAWHKFNSLGFWAKVHEGKNILINPIVTTGMGADFDGDAQRGRIIIAVKQQ